MVSDVPRGSRAGKPWRWAKEAGRADCPAPQELTALPSKTTSSSHVATLGRSVCQLAGTTILALA